MKNFESAPPVTVSQEKDDLILYSNQLIPEVKKDALILDCPVLVQDKDDQESETLVFEEDNSSETEMDVGACQVFDSMPKRRKSVLAKKWMWKFTRKRKKRMKLEQFEKKCVKSNKDESHYGSMRQRMKEYEIKRNRHKLEQKKLLQGPKRVLKKLGKLMKHKFKQKNHKEWIKLYGVVLRSWKLSLTKKKNTRTSIHKKWDKAKHKPASEILLDRYETIGKKHVNWQKHRFRQKHVVQRKKIDTKALVIWLTAGTRQRTKFKQRRGSYGEFLFLIITSESKLG